MSFSLSVNSNAPRLNRSLDNASAIMRASMERLASGKKINSASDDAAGFAISERMTSQIIGLNRVLTNVSDGISLVQAAQATTKEVTDIVQRIRELTVQALSDLTGARGKENIQTEIEALIDEVDKISAQTKFNGREIHRDTMYSIQTGIDDGDQLHFHANYINPSTLGTAVAGVNSYTNGGGVLTIDVDTSHMDSGSHKFAVGDIALLYNFNPPNSVTGTSFYVANVSDNSDGSQTLTIGFSPGDSLQASDQAILAGENAYLLTVAEYHGGSSIGAGGSKSLANLDVTDPAKASTALDTIDGAIRYLTSGAISMGSLESRLEFSKSNFLVVNEATQAARSNIQDADFAAESARLAKSMVLRDSAAAMVSQSRVQSELVLMLLKNVM